MDVLKRWWWVGALVIVGVAFAAYALVGKTPQVVPPSITTEATASVSPAVQPTSSSASTAPTGAATQPSSSGKKKQTAKKQPPLAKTVVVVPKGTRLTTVTAPPPNTLAQIRYSQARNDQMYDVVIRPYGTGPMRAGHGTVVVVVDSSKAQKTYEQPVDLNGVNALLEPGPKIQGAVVVGGTYTGVVRLLRRGDVLVLELVSAKEK